MFSRASFEMIREKALFRVQDQLEQIGVRNDFIDNRANAVGDMKMRELLKLIDTLTTSIEKLQEAVSTFQKGIMTVKESAVQVHSASSSFAPEKGQLIGQSYDEVFLRKELQEQVLKPARQRLRELTDIKNRVREAEILRIEVNAKRDAVDKIRNQKNATPVQIGKAEDIFAEKSVQYDQNMLRLGGDHSMLIDNAKSMYNDLLDRFRICQYKFLMSAAANLSLVQDIQDDNKEESNETDEDDAVVERAEYNQESVPVDLTKLDDKSLLEQI